MLTTDLFSIIFLKKTKILNRKKKIQIFLDILDGLIFLHNNGFVHCDLKFPNILLDQNGIAKITDFGIAKSLSSSKGFSKKTILLGFTQRYVPFEYLDKEIVSTKFDIYSLGFMLYEVFSGKLAWNGLTGFQVVAEVSKKTPFFMKNMKTQDNDIDNIIEKCTLHEKNIRPTAEEVKESLIKL